MNTLDTPFDHAEALRACARGERSALRSIYELEHRWLIGVALRITRQRELAEDAVHDAFVQIWTRASSFDARLGSGRGWICTVVRHRALDLVRSRGARRETEHDEAHVQALLEATQGAGVDASGLVQCLERLDAAKRDCIVLSFVDGLSHEELAERLQTPLGTVKSWVRRGLVALRECLS
ncbi:sigma-70 family RNA polymerase sigma factor [soil metagenome]